MTKLVRVREFHTGIDANEIWPVMEEIKEKYMTKKPSPLYDQGDEPFDWDAYNRNRSELYGREVPSSVWNDERFMPDEKGDLPIVN